MRRARRGPGGERTQLALGDGLDVDRSLRLVERERLFAEDFGETPVRVTPREVELEQAIRALHVAFGEIHISIAARNDVGDVAPVAHDLHRCVEPGDDDRSLRLGRAVQRDRNGHGVRAGDDEHADGQRDGVAFERTDDGRRRRGVGALQHPGIGSLEEAHVRVL